MVSVLLRLSFPSRNGMEGRKGIGEGGRERDQMEEKEKGEEKLISYSGGRRRGSRSRRRRRQN